MTFLVERLVELNRHVEHLQTIAPRVQDRAALQRDLSLHNDVLFSVLMVAQLVIDIAGELSARRPRPAISRREPFARDASQFRG